jgi:2-dehydro-3-deoxyphosphooctonate aldolase (KDO 8-P synthase)
MKLCGFDVGLERPFFLISGPCVVESEQLQMDTAGTLKELTASLGIPFIFQVELRQGQPLQRQFVPRPRNGKGPGDPGQGEEGAEGPVLTDVHTEATSRPWRRSSMCCRTPAFLCRQTDFIPRRGAVGQAGQHQEGPVPRPRRHEERVIDKARAAAREKGLPEDSFMACERGASFGYNNLVSDMRSLAIMRETGAPVVFRRHSLRATSRRPGHQLGRPARIRASALACSGSGRRGGLFMETHPNRPRRSATGRTPCRSSA